MADSDKPQEERCWTGADEENLLLEVSEDRRLRRLGIDPDGDPLEIYLQLERRMDVINVQKLARKSSPK